MHTSVRVGGRRAERAVRVSPTVQGSGVPVLSALGTDRAGIWRACPVRANEVTTCLSYLG